MSVATTPRHDDLIYDVGMHKGEDTEFYLKKGFRVVAFEANPDLVRHCRQVFEQQLRDRRLTIIEGAIVNADEVNQNGMVTFFKNTNDSVWGTARKNWAERNEMLSTSSVQMEVKAINFEEILQKYGIPYYMKIDIEGCDKICLLALQDFYNKPNYISIESEKIHFSELLEEFIILKGLGYNHFKAIQQADVHRSSPPSPAKEGNDIPYQFAKGASGVFGEETPGIWLNERDIMKKYKSIFREYRLLGDYSFLRRSKFGKKLLRRLQKYAGRPLPGWYDTHAKHGSML
jgi:FkbM family methyltransferase